MARARNIKASFFQNPELGDLYPLERLCFIGMWTIADYRGCIEFKAKRMKIQLLPYDECCIEKIVINLEQAGLIRVYSVQGQPYIKVINFVKHQNPHKNERDSGSNIPDIESDDHSFEENRSEYRGLGKIRNNRDKARINRNEDGSARADSLFLIPDSGILIADSAQLVAQQDKPAKKPDLDYSQWPNMPSEQTMIDWLAMRKRLKAPISQTVINRFALELRKAKTYGYSVDECLAECVTRGWRGFETQWLVNSAQSGQYKTAAEKASERNATTFDYEKARDF